MFSSLGTARLVKRSDANTLAKMLAQSAVEEVLVKITNNAAHFGPENRYLYTAYATRAMAHVQGFELDQVQVLGFPAYKDALDIRAALLVKF